MSEYTFNLGEDGGRYYARIYDPSDRWRTRLSLLTTQKSVARQRLAEWERMAARGEWNPRDGRPRKGERLPLEQAITKFLESYRQDVRDVTARNMQSALSMLVGELGPDTPVRHIRPRQIQSFIEDLSGHGSDAPPGSASMSTKAQKYSYLNTFFSWLAERSILEESPMATLSRPRVDDGAQTYEVLSPEEATRLLRACEPEGRPWWPQFVEVALCSGLRISELHHLKWQNVETGALEEVSPSSPSRSSFVEIEVGDVRTGDGTLWQPKNRYSYRSVQLYPRGAAVLRRRWNAQGHPSRGWVWTAQVGTYKGRRPTIDKLQELMRQYGRTAGLRPQRQVTIHDCRHTWFSWLLNDLGLAERVPAISEMGGHGKIEQTWSYVTTSEDSQKEAVMGSVGAADPGGGREEAVRRWLTSRPFGAEKPENESPQVDPQNARSEG